MQWRNEIEAHSTGMDVLVWHGAARENNVKVLKKYDVVRLLYRHVVYSPYLIHVPGPHHVRRAGKLLPEATEWIQT